MFPRKGIGNVAKVVLLVAAALLAGSPARAADGDEVERCVRLLGHANVRVRPANRVAAQASGRHRSRGPDAMFGRAEVRGPTQPRGKGSLAQTPARSFPAPGVPPATGPAAARRVARPAALASG